jgi:hypothetical protein
MQRLAQLVVSLRVELRESNAVREELESRLLLEGESGRGKIASAPNDGDEEDDDSARLLLKEENAVLRADVDALFAEQDDLRGEEGGLGRLCRRIRGRGATEHERWLAETKFESAVFVYNYPKKILTVDTTIKCCYEFTML